MIEQPPSQIALTRIAPTGFSFLYYFIFSNSHEIQLNDRGVAFTAQKIEKENASKASALEKKGQKRRE